MYSAVLRHCEAFEQNDNFKDDMGMLSNRKHQNHMYDPSDDGSTTSTNFGSEFSNPFRSDIYTEQTVFHPVEQGLLDAKRFVDEEEDSSNFKNTRAKVLHYLEPQYQRFATAAKNIVDFIKEHKRRGELFDPCRRVRPVHDSRKVCIAMVLLEEFAESFKWDIPFSIKWKFRKLQRRIEERYSISPAGFSLGRLRTTFELDELKDFKGMFRDAFECLDDQYLEIVQFRKGLFKWDVFNERGCDIEVDPLTPAWHALKVDWDKAEPYVGVYAHNDFPESGDETDIEDAGCWSRGWSRLVKNDRRLRLMGYFGHVKHGQLNHSVKKLAQALVQSVLIDLAVS
jgi:hypothetical protein